MHIVHEFSNLQLSHLFKPKTRVPDGGEQIGLNQMKIVRTFGTHLRPRKETEEEGDRGKETGRGRRPRKRDRPRKETEEGDGGGRRPRRKETEEEGDRGGRRPRRKETEEGDRGRRKVTEEGGR
jgi:hypothetical protein